MAEVLTAEPPALEAMGRAGAKRVAEQHNVYTEVAKLVELFSGVIPSCRREAMMPRPATDARRHHDDRFLRDGIEVELPAIG